MTIVLKKASDLDHIKEILGSLKKVRTFDAYRFCGKIDLKESPIAIQKRMRDEWE